LLRSASPCVAGRGFPFAPAGAALRRGRGFPFSSGASSCASHFAPAGVRRRSASRPGLSLSLWRVALCVARSGPFSCPASCGRGVSFLGAGHRSPSAPRPRLLSLPLDNSLTAAPCALRPPRDLRMQKSLARAPCVGKVERRVLAVLALARCTTKLLPRDDVAMASAILSIALSRV
jgi:hypothetical protein